MDLQEETLVLLEEDFVTIEEDDDTLENVCELVVKPKLDGDEVLYSKVLLEDKVLAELVLISKVELLDSELVL